MNKFLTPQNALLIYDRDVSELYPDFTPLTQAQSDFHDANENANVQEIINCEFTPPYIQTNADISRNRQEQYKQRSDSYYLSWQKDLALGELEKAEINRVKWLNECLLIEQENPYNA